MTRDRAQKTPGDIFMNSFLDGAARLLDIGVVLEPLDPDLSENDADANAIRSDWAAVGADLSSAMKRAR